MALEAYLEASVATAKGAAGSGRCRTGLDRNKDLRVSKECWHAGDQFQGRFFLVRSMRGRVKQPNKPVYRALGNPI